MALFTKILIAIICLQTASLGYSMFRYQRTWAAYQQQIQVSNTALEGLQASLEAFNRAETQRALAYEQLAITEDLMSSIRLENRDLEAQILSAADDQDGDVAPILEAVRKQKFGGVK